MIFTFHFGEEAKELSAIKHSKDWQQKARAQWDGCSMGSNCILICNDKGEIMSFSISKGNVDDRIPVRDLVKDLHGSLIGYRGYIDFKLFEDLMAKGLKLITRIKTNMKNKLVPLIDKILLRKRSIIETINDQLKNIYQIEHTRHRSHINFLVNLFSRLAAYSLSPKKHL